MSVETTTHPDERPALDPAAVFERYIEADPLVCNSCFRRVQPEEGNGHNCTPTGTTGERVVTDDGEPAPRLDVHDHHGPMHDAGDRVVGTEPIETHSATYLWEPHDVCPHCGELGLASPDDPLPRERVRDRAVAISCRLRERSIPHDWFALVYVALGLKAKPALAGQDREIAARATKVAVSRALERR